MKKILAIDGNSILNRAFYGIRLLSNQKGVYTNAIYGMVNIVMKQVELLAPDYCAVAFDVKHPTFRHELYDLYKAGRHETPPELLMQLPIAKDVMRALGLNTLELAGYEADDILGTLSAFAKRENCQAYLLTGDKDSLQLISDHTTVLLATNKETVNFDRAHFNEVYGIEPSQFVDVKALMGDSSDNIP
ncbi:MAG: DNA polymerase I, partial [Clostridia bacterium]|nr:DNA polymerase I [Clostridia bacterium]